LIGQTGDILGHNIYAYTANNPVMYHDPDGELATITIVALTLLAGGVASAIGQGFSNFIEGETLTNDLDVAFTKGVIATGFIFIPAIGPLASIAAYSSLNQIESTLSGDEWSWSEFGLDTSLGLISMGIASPFTTKINKAWLTNLKFNNILSNLVNGKVSRYALKNFALGVGADSVVTLGKKVYDYASEVVEGIKENISSYKNQMEEGYTY
jgi:hypothetical protein